MSKSGDTMKGAAQGAAMGAPLGPWGAGLGALGGGLYGYFSSSDDEPDRPTGPQMGPYQQAYLKKFLAQGAPQMDQGASQQVRNQQEGLAQMLYAQSAGRAPGAGELAVQRQIGNATAQQTAQASMARGANAALAMRNAARNQANIGVNGAGQAAIAQMNDQTAARSQLGGLLGQTRQQDLFTANANQNAALTQSGLQMNGLAQMLNVDQSTLNQINANNAATLAEKQRRDAQMAALIQAGGTALTAYGAGSGASEPKPVGANGYGGSGYTP